MKLCKSKYWKLLLAVNHSCRQLHSWNLQNQAPPYLLLLQNRTESSGGECDADCSAVIDLDDHHQPSQMQSQKKPELMMAVTVDVIKSVAGLYKHMQEGRLSLTR